MESVTHELEPIYNTASKLLILGSFPSVKSREQGFYYGHPQNRFWKVLAAVCGQPVPQTISEKKEFLLGQGIAIWDIVASCELEGSSDSSIRNVTVTELSRILEQAPIQELYANGRTAEKLYQTYAQERYKRPIIGLPSTSPANAAYTMERLVPAWSVIQRNLKEALPTSSVWK